jgi:hypothetical protein
MYFAVEIGPEESLDTLAQNFMTCAQTYGSKLKQLHALGPLWVGSTHLMRFQTDCARAYVIKFGQVYNRSYVTPTPQGPYEFVRSDGEVGVVAAAKMQTPPLPMYAHRKFKP